MKTVKARLDRLECRANPRRQPRLILLNPGEVQSEALTRLGIPEGRLAFERQEGRKIIWIRWAG